ncbi:MAG: hypothetical protein WD054_04915 [Gemmatimonadota bacterium]
MTDAELMQVLDAESGAAATHAHTSGCAQCADRVEQLRDDAELVRLWLGAAAFDEADTPVPQSALAFPRPPARVPGWMRAAAVLLLVAGPVAALPQLRQWLIEAATGTPAAAPAPAAVETLSTQAATASFRFASEGSMLAVAFDATPTAGTLTIRSADGAEAVLEIAGAAGAGPVLSASGVRMRNDAASAASYVLSVPSSVTAVTVTAGGRALGTFERAAIAGIVVLELGIGW